MEYRLSIPVSIDGNGAGNGVQIPDTKETQQLCDGHWWNAFETFQKGFVTVLNFFE